MRRLGAQGMIGIDEALDANAKGILILRQGRTRSYAQQKCEKRENFHKPFSSFATVKSDLSTLTLYCEFLTTMVVLCSVCTFFISIF